MDELIQSFFNVEIAAAALPIVIQGLLNTILLSLLVVPLGLLGGIVLALLAHSRSLNLSNAVAVLVYEAWRQVGFVTNGQ